MKALTIVRNVILASAVILVVAGICAGPTIYSEISKTMREDAGAIARLIEETLEEQKRLLQSQKEFPPEESGNGEHVVIHETKATLSDFEKAGQTLSTLIFKWMTISILIVMAILCALAFIRFVLSPRERGRNGESIECIPGLSRDRALCSRRTSSPSPGPL